MQKLSLAATTILEMLSETVLTVTGNETKTNPRNEITGTIRERPSVTTVERTVDVGTDQAREESPLLLHSHPSRCTV